MRRSDEEFKAELKARARKYRAMREKRRVAMLKTVSAAMAACLLVVVVSQIDFAWIGRDPQTTTEAESTNEGETVRQTEGSEPETLENPQTVAGAEEAPSQEELVPDASAGDAQADSSLDKIMVQPGSQIDWIDGIISGVENYEASEATRKLADFLKELDQLPRKEEITEEWETDESTSLMSKSYEIKVFYEDGTPFYCRVVPGEETKWVQNDVILLDQQTWGEWMTLYEAVKNQVQE